MLLEMLGERGEKDLCLDSEYNYYLWCCEDDECKKCGGCVKK